MTDDDDARHELFGELPPETLRALLVHLTRDESVAGIRELISSTRWWGSYSRGA